MFLKKFPETKKVEGKLDSNRIKELIVELIKENPGCIKCLWEESDRESIDESELTNVKIWKRSSKEKYKGVTHRTYVPSRSRQDQLAEDLNLIIEIDENNKILQYSFEA